MEAERDKKVLRYLTLLHGRPLRQRFHQVRLHRWRDDTAPAGRCVALVGQWIRTPQLAHVLPDSIYGRLADLAVPVHHFQRREAGTEVIGYEVGKVDVEPGRHRGGNLTEPPINVPDAKDDDSGG